MIRDLLRKWRKYRLVSYIQDQREYQRLEGQAADSSMEEFSAHTRLAVQHARAARRAEIELEGLENGR